MAVYSEPAVDQLVDQTDGGSGFQGDGTSPPVALQTSISLSFVLCGIDITLLAASPIGDSGWEFEGGTGPGQEIKVGELISKVTKSFGSEQALPGPLEGLTTKELEVSYNTLHSDFSLACEVDLPVSAERVLAIKPSVNVTEGQIAFGLQFKDTPLKFKLIFEHYEHEKSDAFAACYSAPKDSGKINICQVIQAVTGGEGAFAEWVKDQELCLDLKDVVFVFYKGAAKENTGETKILFGIDIDIGARMNLSSLPLVGKQFTQDIGIENLHLVIVSQSFSVEEVKTAIKLIDGVTTLPDASLSGLTLSASLKLGEDNLIPLLLSSGADKNEVATARDADPPSTNSAGPAIKWFNVKKTFGPVHFERLGFQYLKTDQDQTIMFLMDSSLSAAGLSLSLNGLGLGWNIKKSEPSFKLSGLGIDFKQGPVEIGGAFLQTEVLGDDGKLNYYEYAGKAILRIKAFSLSAIGSYADPPGVGPSLFIYAVLDYPLGGPSFFFVTGLAAGFGYNRGLKMPAMDEVPAFPLVQEACGAKTATAEVSSLGDELKLLQEYVPIQAGQYFLVAGIKFTSFKMIDSFAMLAVSFGQHFEIDLLGISTIRIPPALPGSTVPILAEIQVAFKASFIPDEGFLGLAAQLTSSSFILSKDCHLTGGLAFYCWFAGKHAGDFVLTVGGYHPDFKVPEHYPQVPRLGISWKVDEHLSIKGDAYFALTPSMLMAGGHLEANWNSGPLAAWFKAGLDLIIAWKPFHYDAHLYIDMGVSYTYEFFGTHHITVDLGADLHIWGPEFAGIAHIHLWFITVDVQFGTAPLPTQQHLDWSQFEDSFLPKDLLSVSVKDGLVSKDTSPNAADSDMINLGVINPKDLCLVVDSVVPIAQSPHWNERPPNSKERPPSFGIAPMMIQSVETKLTITITNGKGTTCEQVDFVQITKNVPAGLWGTKFPPTAQSTPLVDGEDGVLTGFEVKVKPPKQGEAVNIQCAKLQYDKVDYRMNLCWEKDLGVTPAKQEDDSARRKDIRDGIESSASRRKEMLAALGLGNEVLTLDGNLAAHFVVAPQVEAARG